MHFGYRLHHLLGIVTSTASDLVLQYTSAYVGQDVRSHWDRFCWHQGSDDIQCLDRICGRSYKHFTIGNYDSRVVTDWKIPHITTLEL